MSEYELPAGYIKTGFGNLARIARGPNKGRVRIRRGPHRGRLGVIERSVDQNHNALVRLLEPPTQQDQ